ncbi:MAG: TonB family protein [Qingshengfaniella sp.]
MMPVSFARIMPVMALALSVMAHLGGAALSAGKAPESSGGGGGQAAPARLGAGFEDLVAGSLGAPEASQTPDLAETPPPDRAQPVAPRPVSAPSPITPAQAAPANAVLPTSQPSEVSEPQDPPTEQPQQPAPQKRAEPRKPSPPAPTGNADRNEIRGSASGQADARATRQSSGAPGAATGSGRAAAGYPDRVMARIAKTRRDQIRGGGNATATVAFSVAADGRLASVSLARASGNPKLDKIAVQHVRRAAPFPAPPPGAQRSFTITYSGRR